MFALHHLHLRKRSYVKLEPYPHPDVLKNRVDKLIYATALLTPVVTIPQAYQIFSAKTSAGVSVFSWICFAIANVIWVIYGVIHNEKPIIISNTANFVINIIVVIGAIMY